MFFPSNPNRTAKIAIDLDSLSSESPEVHRRLTRIEENYERLDAILGDLELKMQADECLKAIDDPDVDFEQTFGVKRKRKWRPVKAKSKAKRRSSRTANPKKPR